MKVYQIGNGRIYKESAFKNRVRNLRKDHTVRVFSLESESSVENFLASRDRSRRLDALLDPNENIGAFRDMINDRISRIKPENARDYRANRQISDLKAYLDFDNEKQLKDKISKRGRYIMQNLCETVNDFVTILSIHNFRGFKFDRKYLGYNNTPRYEVIPNDKAKLYDEAKKILSKRRKESKKDL